jgi:hypothetical protein
MKITIYSSDPKTKRKSVTLTILLITFMVCITKLLLSNMVINDWTVPEFTASDFAVALAAAGALYSARKYTDKDKPDSSIEGE